MIGGIEVEQRIGFIGIVLTDLAQAPRANQVIAQYQDIVEGRIGVPDHENDMGVVGLIVRGDDMRVSQLTAKLGNIPGASVKSAMTNKNKGSNQNEKTD